MDFEIVIVEEPAPPATAAPTPTPAAPAPSAGKRVAIAFFSLTGNTRHAAQRIRAQFLQHPDRVSAVDLLDVTGPTQPPPDSFANADIIGIGSMAWWMREPTMLREWLSRVPVEHVVGKPVFVYTTSGGHPGSSMTNVCKILASKGAVIIAIAEFLCPDSYTRIAPKDRPLVWEAKDRVVVDTFAAKAFALSTAQPPTAVNRGARFLGRVASAVCSDTRVRWIMGIIKVDQSKCISCGLCARICPRGAIAMHDIEDAPSVGSPSSARGSASGSRSDSSGSSPFSPAEVRRARRMPVVDGAACVGCCRCINHCPKNALNSSSTKGRMQYVFREDP